MRYRLLRGGLPWLWLSALVLVLDQTTKYLAVRFLDVHEPVPVIPFLDLTLAYNPGAAFSLLSTAGGWQRWFFVAVAAVVSVVLVVWLARLSVKERWLSVALALILGGAVGNLVDRLVHGQVVDFIDVYYGQWHWPAFNVADSAITVGVIVLILQSFWQSKGEHE